MRARTPQGPEFGASSRKPPRSRQNQDEFSGRSGDRAVAHLALSGHVTPPARQALQPVLRQNQIVRLWSGPEHSCSRHERRPPCATRIPDLREVLAAARARCRSTRGGPTGFRTSTSMTLCQGDTSFHVADLSATKFANPGAFSAAAPTRRGLARPRLQDAQLRDTRWYGIEPTAFTPAGPRTRAAVRSSTVAAWKVIRSSRSAVRSRSEASARGS